MKNHIKLISIILGLVFLLNFSGPAQGTSPPPPPGQHNLSDNQPPVGGNAIIGSGIAMLLIMGLCYSFLKISSERRGTGET